ncbi:unnamed protein product [Rotaria sp. Silwood1]|nr:unnamed protein product [Rotaria sp. Silwood1]CAF1415856.1 unnamed protein product [Rotaria sp. Silwood1]CAF3623982.1 unnamed protein product [Rotaria sp. Silwood1]CAF3675079.1 unnamed protein product [Rotaria sp. Silwood1]CAF4595282.1 unnamed protein product [Rotaria sp. Silwood1]
MAVKNRFETFTFLSTNEESVQSSFFDVTSSDHRSQINNKQQTKNYWDVPEYIEKPISCSSIVHIKQVEIPRIVEKTKSSVNVKNTKDDKEDEVKSSETIEVQNQPKTYSYYPPQPYKLKQNLLSNYNSIHNKLFQLKFFYY